MNKKNKSAKIHINVMGREIPARVYWERRNNVRASIGKNAAILRLPVNITIKSQEEQLESFIHWVNGQFEKNTDLQRRFFGKGYKDGDTLKVGTREYLLQFHFSERASHSGKLKDGIIRLELNQNDHPNHLQKAIKHLLSRLVAQDFLPFITNKVKYINDTYFQQHINSVNLKYNQTNWGSCSSKRNINLSTRLLFAPDAVINYVIVHELAHLIELNHSDRFWKIVSDVMPKYKKAEDWLKEYGRYCDF